MPKRTLITAAVSAILVFAFLFLVLGRIDAALTSPFGWTLNLFASLPSERSWFLGSLLYRFLFGVIAGCVVGFPIGLLVASGRTAAGVALLALLPSISLVAWVVRSDPWLLFSLGVVALTTPAIAWWSSSLRATRASLSH